MLSKYCLSKLGKKFYVAFKIIYLPFPFNIGPHKTHPTYFYSNCFIAPILANFQKFYGLFEKEGSGNM